MKNGFSPSLYQLRTLSRASGYRIEDWLRVFGYDLGAVLRLIVEQPTQRTIMLDPALDDDREQILWLIARPGAASLHGIQPIGELIEVARLQQAQTLNIDGSPISATSGELVSGDL